LLLKFIFTLLKTALKIEPKSIFEVDSYQANLVVKEKVLLGRKFQGFCDIFNGIRAIMQFY